MSSVLQGSFDIVSGLFGYLLPFLFVLAIVVFVHEMGHFLVGRLCGVKVETFSLGFGPRIARFYDRRGTEWAISAIPLGGYVKFKGDLNAASVPDHAGMAAIPADERGDSFPHKPVAQRAAIVAAGPLANFVLAFVIFTLSYMLVGRTLIAPVIGAVNEGSVAAATGFQAGDRVLAIDGEPVGSFDEIARKVSVSEGQRLIFRIERAGREIELAGEPAIMSRKTVLGTDRRPVMGFVASRDPAHFFRKYYGLGEASTTAIGEIVFVIDRTVHYVSGLVAGRERADQLSGPTRIAYISGKVAESGIAPLLMLAGILSISIGLINLLPVPMLDGGHLVFYAIEAIFGRPVSPRAQEISFRVGFALVIMLMLFSTWNDLVHLTGFAL
ncbi:MAG: RIP metalloprotease RseP [Hyphomicrobiales bacterium]|uniref:RIP metalloprotease RseP n=1 Tax=Rhabdaerophilum calidifontis TaxID=2604328 RepID=UPI001FE3AEEE|nr:RIP metalloprotease RseP [Rhabdaerophilum calidifontis]MCA1951962.1 RIP metalloprotease RseP [Hyphomicrobiales bacterium]MCA1998839.1 RIP metalloprotease RseP [Hyphomicrobiales bacterium]